MCHTIIQQKIDGTAKYCEHKTWNLFSQMSLKYMVLVLYIILLLCTMYHIVIDFDTIFKASLVGWLLNNNFNVGEVTDVTISDVVK